MKVLLTTFGCRANQYDSESVRAMLQHAGHELVERAEDADTAIFNGCVVTADAEADLRSAIRVAARRQPALRSMVMGCAGGRTESRAQLAALPSVQHIVPGADAREIAMALDLPPESAAIVAARQMGARALLRVQDGCDEHCTFCATTLARGAHRSRATAEIVAEAQQLAERHQEIVITGIHIGSYGADIDSSLSALVARVLRATEDSGARVRLSSLEATEVDDAMREMLRDPSSRLVPHLHAPLQSGSDAVLRRMGRHWYTASSYAAAIDKTFDGQTIFGLGADVIAGFPGETDADHRATCALLDQLPFTYLHVFPWSPRPGTAATRLPNPVGSQKARERAAELRAIGDAKRSAHVAARAGTLADVVATGSGERREGVTEDYLSVNVAAHVARGTRFTARLTRDARGLRADPAHPEQ